MKNPIISIIIPVAPYRDAEIVESIKKSNYPKNKYEILIQKGTNPSKNRNLAAKKAKGKILAILDDDAVVEKNLFQRAEEFFKKYPKRDIVGGPQLTPKDDKFFAKATGAAFSSFWGTHNICTRYSRRKLNLDADELSLSSANCFVRKSAYKKIGGFDESIWPGEDPEFFSRAKIKGFKLAYSPNLIVFHRRRAEVLAFMKQFSKYGYVRLKKEKILNTKPNIFFLMPSLFVLYLITLPFLLWLNYIFILPLVAHITISILISLVLVARNKIWLAFPILPIIFILLHISYGFGFIKGIIDRLVN